MTKKYFEEIEILEWVILKLNNEEALIQRDWSSFFDIKFFNWKDFLFEDNNWEEEEKIKNKISKNKKITEEEEIFLFMIYIKKKVNNKFKSIQEYFEIDENTKNKPLNGRIYNLKIKKEVIDFIKNFYNTYRHENYRKNNFSIGFIEENNFTLQKYFNPKAFFSDHESLFDKENDFLQNKKVFLGLKNEKKEELNTLEDQINKLKSEQKFYVKVNLKNLENENMKFDWSKKYENIFILERWDYIYHTKKEKNG